MSISESLKSYLDKENANYECVHHPYSEGARETAISGKVPIDQMAKAVVLEDHEGQHLMAVVPASNHINLDKLGTNLHRDLHLVEEDRLQEMFRDCAPGAIPALGHAFHMETVVDDQLLEQDPVYIEAGDHEDLVRVKGETFRQLVSQYPHMTFSSPRDAASFYTSP